MKRIITILILCFPLLFSHVYAQDEVIAPPTSPNKIEVEVYSGTQSPINKSIPIYVKFRTNFDSDNVGISWNVPYGVEIDTKHPNFVKATSGKTYTYKARVIPEIAGSYSIAADITAWQFNTNYNGSAQMTIKIGQNLITDPVDPSYTILSIVMLLVLVVIAGVAIFFGIRGFKKFSKIFVKWLNPPD